MRTTNPCDRVPGSPCGVPRAACGRAGERTAERVERRAYVRSTMTPPEARRWAVARGAQAQQARQARLTLGRAAGWWGPSGGRARGCRRRRGRPRRPEPRGSSGSASVGLCPWPGPTGSTRWRPRWDSPGPHCRAPAAERTGSATPRPPPVQLARRRGARLGAAEQRRSARSAGSVDDAAGHLAQPRGGQAGPALRRFEDLTRLSKAGRYWKFLGAGQRAQRAPGFACPCAVGQRTGPRLIARSVIAGERSGVPVDRM